MKLLLFIGAIFFSVFYGAVGFRYPISGGGESVAVSNSLLLDGSFSNPFAAARTGPTASLAPGYPAFRAAIFWLFRSKGLLVLLIVTLAMHGLHAALLPHLSRVLFGEPWPGLWAALLAMVLPLFEVMHWEAIYVAAGLVGFCIFTASERGFQGWFVAGLFAAALFLTNPSCVFVFTPWLISRSLALKELRPLVLAFLLACAPWTIRNYIRFHHFVPVRDDLGLVLYASNNDCAAPTLLENLQNGCHERVHPIESKPEAMLVAQLGEIAYNRNRLMTAIRWMKDNPRRFLALTSQRLREFWFPTHAYSFGFVTVLSIPALRRKRMLLAILLLYPALYYLTEASPRYRYPVMWVSLLQAGFVIEHVRKHRKLSLYRQVLRADR